MTEWLKLSDIAAALRVPEKSVYDYVRRGDGPVVHKFGKHLRVKHTDYEAWEEAHLIARH